MNEHLDFLLSPLYDRDALAPEHLVDLRKSGLSAETIRAHKFRSVPPDMIERLLGFPVRKVVSAYLIPFPDPGGGFMDHIRFRIFPPFKGKKGTVKYLGPRGAAPHLFFAIPTMSAAVDGDAPLWLVEGAKKSAAVGQLGLPAVGFEGIEGWHVAGSHELLPDFEHLRLRGRIVELVPDGDVATNPDVQRGAERFAAALARAGARPRLVTLPTGVVA